MNRQKVILITGASSGFGKAFAQKFASKGYKVFGTSRNADYTEKNGVVMIPMNVTDNSSIEHAIAFIKSEAGFLDILVNNAGYGISGSVEDTTIEEAKALFDTNFFGAHRVCRAAIPIMRDQNSGHIINIGSLGGVISIPFQAFYSATKSAFASLSDGLSMELQPYGIKVTRIEPGDYATGFTAARIMVKESGSQSVYNERCKKAISIMEHDEENGADCKQLAEKVLKIAETNKPRLVYREGMFIQKSLVSILNYLPNRLVQKILMDTYVV
ncbi:MAG: short-subunit dehydrogenase [Candidatus Azotimanducaceae bacterium]|jgi:short-subunit dehydrogenase